MRKVEGFVLGWGLTILFGFITTVVGLMTVERFEGGVTDFGLALRGAMDTITEQLLVWIGVSVVVGVLLHGARRGVQNAAQNAQRWMARFLFMILLATVVTMFLV